MEQKIDLADRGLWRSCAQRACRRRGICLGLEFACGPKPPRPRKPISRAERKRRVHAAVLHGVSRIARSIASRN